MKVGHVIGSLGPGGAERLVVDLCAALEKVGLSSRIVTLGHTDDSSPPLVDAACAGLDVKQVGSHRFDPRAWGRLRSELNDCDIVHAHLFPASHIVAALPMRQPRILTEHSTENRRRSQAALPLERYVYRRYDVVTAISGGVARSLSNFLGDDVLRRVVVIPNGVDVGRFRAEPRPRAVGPLRCIAIGTLDDRKQVEQAVAAVAQCPGSTLTVVGDGPGRPLVDQTVHRFGLADRVAMLGTRRDVPELLRNHDVLIMTSRYEGFGLVAVEAMAAGLPVIAPAVPGLDEVVQHGRNGILYPPGDIAALANAIVEVSSDEAGRMRLAAGAFDAATQHDVRVAARAYAELYADIAGRRRPGRTGGPRE